jgi:hypothetical protein
VVTGKVSPYHNVLFLVIEVGGRYFVIDLGTSKLYASNALHLHHKSLQPTITDHAVVT